MHNVERLHDQVGAAFDEASVRLHQAIRAIFTDHANRGLLKSGATIRRVVEAAEGEARSAVERSREMIAGSKSVILRARLAEFIDAGIDRIRGQVTERLSAMDLDNPAGRVLLNEALGRASRQPAEPISTRLDRARKAGGRVAGYIGHNIVLALAMAVVGGIATAVALKALSLD